MKCLFAALSVIGIVGLWSVSTAGAQPAEPNAGGRGGFPDLVAGLKATPGCLGVVTSGKLSTGQQAIFAFFENKEAALRWYYSPMHLQIMKMVGTEPDGNAKPMADLPDDVPIMAVASITMGGAGAIEGSPVPISQISIELYAPLSGGLNINGGFSPDAFRAGIKAPATHPAGD